MCSENSPDVWSEALSRGYSVETGAVDRAVIYYFTSVPIITHGSRRARKNMEKVRSGIRDFFSTPSSDCGRDFTWGQGNAASHQPDGVLLGRKKGS
jgi:hypothetical protein